MQFPFRRLGLFGRHGTWFLAGGRFIELLLPAVLRPAYRRLGASEPHGAG